MNGCNSNSKVAALFDAVVELEGPEQRAQYLARECPDPRLRAEVESLLAAHQHPETVFTRTRRMEASAPEAAGTVIDRYKLLEAIGEGGFGTVWLAEQKEPMRRKVALKVIKHGMDTKSVVARFEAERQALALMDHPNIAKVFDAGTTAGGRPYFVMELVRGIPITKFCDENKLTTRDRLDLFIKVCHAVQHAHQKGIIHRDLKPSNVLVTLHDSVPVPKVIDFGIAKATQQDLTEKTIHTQFQQFIGTPAYVSPEQAEMSGLDIDTRSDIYSLGVLLYELLTGVTPFNAQTLMQSGLDEMRRIIREEEPKRPSTRLSTLGMTDATALARHRREKLPALIHLVRGDLDWIVMKCLEKDRTRRYESAGGLAVDLKRHLNNEPVTACPPSKLYEFQKAVRRHKVGFAAAAVVVVALATGVAISAWQALRASSAEAAAREELENARVALEFIRDDLLGLASPYRQPDPNLTVRKQLDHANAVLKERTALQPKVEAALRQIMGSVYLGLGEYAIAIDLLERGLALERQHLGPGHEETLRTMHILADTYWWHGDDERMLKLAQEGLALSRKALGATNLTTLQFLGDEAAALVYAETGTTEETERVITNALRLTSSTLGETHEMAFRLSVLLAHHQNWRGQYDKVESVLAPAIAREGSVLPETHPLMLFARGTLARAYAEDTNKLPQAKALYGQLLEARQLVLGTNHPMTVNVEIVLAVIHLKAGEFAEADATHRRLLQLVADGHLVETRLCMRGLCNLVGIYRLNKQWAKADELANAVLEAGRKQFKEESINLIAMHDEWGRSLIEQGRYAEAEKHLQTVVDVRMKHTPHGKLFSAMSRLGYCLFKQRKELERAEQLLSKGYLELEQRIPQLPEHLRLEIVGSALQRLIECYDATGQAARADSFRIKLSELQKKEGRQLRTLDYVVPL